MPQVKRIVVPGLPHHVWQRGVRSVRVFADPRDYELYLSLMRTHGKECGLEFLAWCLMSNHLHLVVVPRKEDSLARGIGEAHRRYTQTKNSEADVRGYLFQGRFGSYVMDEPHLLAAVRYVELNPVVAGMVNSPGAYRWSSARFHLGKQPKDPLVEDRRLLGLVSDWEKYLGSGMEELERRRVEQHLRTGRPRGDDRFVSRLEGKLGRVLRPKKRGWREGHRREVSGK